MKTIFKNISMSKIIEYFVWSNISFLAIDTFFAHSVNEFRLKVEWVPVYFSLLVMLVHGYRLLVQKVSEKNQLENDKIGLILGWGSVLVGLAGIFFHLESQFFRERTVLNLIYSAPFVAPLSYTGIGMLYIINRRPLAKTNQMRLILLFATVGMFGNFLLSVLDHAQNGFFNITEWIPVISSALVVAIVFPICIGLSNRLQIQLAKYSLYLQIVVGLIGFVLHFFANIQQTASLWENFVYGAPIFAPLLFVDLAILAFIPLSGLDGLSDT